VRLSVALCIYNGEAHLAEQLDSLAAQSRLPDELVVCDDRSTDATVSIVETFAKRAPFPVRLHVNESNLGSTKNFDRAFGLCQGDVIFPCDQDDVWLPEKLARMQAAFAESPSIGLVVSDAWLVGPNLERTGMTAWPNLPFTRSMRNSFERGGATDVLLRYNVVTGVAMAFRADLRDLVLPIPMSWVHDGWIGFLAAAVADVRLLGEPLVLYRQHGAQQLGIPKRTLARELRTAFHQRDHDYFRGLAESFDDLTARLRQHSGRLRDTSVIERAAEKAAMARSQMRMREVGRLRRIGMALGHLWAGRYRRYNRGWKAFAVDVCLK
jgi:glycosyltransferase involved in cell wall biosynthesis